MVDSVCGLTFTLPIVVGWRVGNKNERLREEGTVK
jgi:hypothetical protein